ncbi:MAG: LytB [Bacillota bacterium]
MEVIFLKNDGRCKWLGNKVLKRLLPEMVNAALDPGKKKMYLIEDWMSNSGGKVGVDIQWLKRMGIPVLKSCKDLPEGNDYIIVNTGYDAVVEEEKLVLDKGVDYLDEPCPYVRKVRKIFENSDGNFQYVLLCEPDHIIIKNFKSIFPEDMILVQMSNYQEKIISQQNGKPLRLLSHATFLPSNVKRILNFINGKFPERPNDMLNTSCLWVSSPSSPVLEINNMEEKELKGVKDALLVTTPGTTNKSAVSLIETLENKGLNVVIISNLKEFLNYEKKNRNSRVLLVRTPIPNNAEKPIITYIKNGLPATYYTIIKEFIELRYRIFFLRLLYRMKYIFKGLFDREKVGSQ